MVATTLTHQGTLYLQIKTPLDKDTFTLQEFEGQEELSKPFEYKVIVISENPAVDFKQLVGQAATVTIAAESTTRAFNGVVGSFTQLMTAREGDDNVTYYQATLHPELWLLNFSKDCRVFQNMSALDIIQDVFERHHITSFEDQTQTCGRTPREYCIQYNESAFNFVTRLLEEEGIFYFFKHTKEGHTMVLGDAPSAHPPCPNAETAVFEKAQAGQDFMQSLVTVRLHQQVVPSAGALADYNFTTASSRLFSKVDGKGEGDRIYTYPGQMDDEQQPKQNRLDELTTMRLQALEHQSLSVEGTSTIPFFAPGFQFQMQGHERRDADRGYVLFKVMHKASTRGDAGVHGEVYINEFTAFPDDLPYRPLPSAIKPRIHSTQTARVTGPIDEEIWTDQYGRVKVKFHWDQTGPDNQDSSCWVRVAEGWSSNNWGILFTPRIGMEVVITFLEGDPDRPLVIGCVYNSDNMPPYLPEQPTKSTIKSNSTKGGDGFNEYRFEDLKGAEQIYMHAQKDWDTHVIETVTKRIEKGSYWWWIERGNREVIIEGNPESVGKTTPPDQILPAGLGDDNLTITQGSRTVKLLGVRPKGNMNEVLVNGDHFREIDEGDTRHLSHKGMFFQQLDDGDHSVYLMQGVVTTAIDVGDHNTRLGQGSMTRHLAKGDFSSIIESGNEYHEQADGDFTRVMRSGFMHEELQSGHKTTILDQGDQTTTLRQGNQNISLENGNRSISVIGNEDHTITGNYTLNITGNLTIKVGGNIEIESTGSTDMKALQAMSFETSMGMSSKAAISIDMDASTDISMVAGAAVSVKATGDIDMTGGNITVTGGGAAEFSGGGTATLSGGAGVEITGSTVTIE